MADALDLVDLVGLALHPVFGKSNAYHNYIGFGARQLPCPTYFRAVSFSPVIFGKYREHMMDHVVVDLHPHNPKILITRCPVCGEKLRNYYPGSLRKALIKLEKFLAEEEKSNGNEIANSGKDHR